MQTGKATRSVQTLWLQNVPVNSYSTRSGAAAKNWRCHSCHGRRSKTMGLKSRRQIRNSDARRELARLLRLSITTRMKLLAGIGENRPHKKLKVDTPPTAAYALAPT